MVLKCNRTGKVFFSHKEAETHGEETGLADFSQVDMSENVWVCVETGKWCYTEVEMDLHKKRVPEAVTFEKKTVADLKAAHEARKAAASSGADDMETEEDAILRAAGKGGKGKGKAPGPPVVTKETVEQLVEMGFTELRAQKALVKTSNAGIEGAINWLTEHLEDADIDDPLDGEGCVVKTQEEVGAEMAQQLAGGGSSQLTAEEKKAKLDEALAKARAKKNSTTIEEEKEKEYARRAGGKEMVKSKRELEEMCAHDHSIPTASSTPCTPTYFLWTRWPSLLTWSACVCAPVCVCVCVCVCACVCRQRKRDMEARKREKREVELERQKLREKLEADREEKRANGTLVVAAAPAAPAAPDVSDKSKAAPKPKSDAERAAEAAAESSAGMKRNYDEEEISLEEAQSKLTALSESKVKPALEMMGKMVANIAKSPAEAKYRKVRLSNPKIGEGLVFVPGARQFLRAAGWQLVEREFLELPVDGDGAAQAQAQLGLVDALAKACAAAIDARQKEENAARRKEAADKAAKQKAEREAMKAAMARDRAEVASRGPAQASVAKKLPSEAGGTMTSAIFSEQEEAEGRRNAQ